MRTSPMRKKLKFPIAHSLTQPIIPKRSLKKMSTTPQSSPSLPVAQQAAPVVRPPPPPPFAPDPLATMTYDQWEQWMIRSYLSRQPEPTGPDSDATIAAHTQLIARYKARIYLIINDLQRLQSIPEDLKLPQTLAEANWKRHVLLARMFPINTFPTEILTNIFRFVVWGATDATESTRQRLQLTWVCRQWRQVAIADQTLWNTIWFRDSAPFERSLAFFERAGTATLDLRINESNRFLKTGDIQYKLSGPQMEALTDVLMTKVEQIRMLILVVDSWPPVLVLLHKLRHSRTPKLLERVEIHRTGRPYTWSGPDYMAKEQWDGLTLCNGTAPSLNFLCVNGVHLDWDNSPMYNLAALDLRRMPVTALPSMERFRDVLAHSPGLRKLSLDGAGPAIPRDLSKLPENPANIDLLHLTTLILGDVHPTWIVTVLGNVTAPNIRDLTLINLLGQDFGHALRFFTGRYPKVVILTIYSLEMTYSAQNLHYMTLWLMSMPLVKYLRIAALRPQLLEAFLQDGQLHLNQTVRLTSTPEDAAQKKRIDILPELVTLEYQHMEVDRIMEFGMRRRAIGLPLRAIYINSIWLPSMAPPDHAKLRSVAPTFVCSPAHTTPAEQELWTKYKYGPAIEAQALQRR